MPVISAHIMPHPPLIVPAVGNGRESDIYKTADAYLRAAQAATEAKPDLIIFITPHSVSYADYIHISPGEYAAGDLGRFGAPAERFRLEYNRAFAELLTETATREGIYCGFLGEKEKALDHGVTVPLFFLHRYWTGFKAVRVSIAGLPLDDHYRFGMCIREAAEKSGLRTVIIASGDLSHKLTHDGPYGFAPEGPAFDAAITDAMRDADFLRLMSVDSEQCEAAAECGLRSFVMMAGALDGCDVATKFGSYEGPFGVGYAVCSYTPIGENNPERHFLTKLAEATRIQAEATRRNESEYVRLARLTVETFAQTGKVPKRPAWLTPDTLSGRAGVFVSIKKQGALRGCIGTTAPTCASIAEEIIQNAISASTNDPRFDPIMPDELEKLTYSVDVLAPPEDIAGADMLDVQKYGVIVSCGHRRGLLLPSLAGVNTVDEQISIALKKGGIAPDESYSLQRFEVVRHK